MYCIEDPISFADSAGNVVNPATLDLDQMLSDSGTGGGGGAAFLWLLYKVLEEFPNAFGEIFQAESKRIGQLASAIFACISVAKAKNYPEKKEDHHIVAKSAKGAAKARDLLIEAGMTVEDPANHVLIGKGLHRILHTKLYYNFINWYIEYLFDAAGGSEAIQAGNIDAVQKSIRSGLRTLQGALSELDKFISP